MTSSTSSSAAASTATRIARVLVPLGAVASLLPFVTKGVSLVAGIVLVLVLALVVGNPCSRATKKLTTPLLQEAVVAARQVLVL